MSERHPKKRRTAALLAVVLSIGLSATSLVASPVDAAELFHLAEIDTVVVRVEPGVDIERLVAANGGRVVAPLVASRGIYVVESTGIGKKSKPKDVAKELEKEDGVIYAELVESDDRLEDDYFHAWPSGDPSNIGDDERAWIDQPGLANLRLHDVHSRSTGDGVVVAVLDTGVDVDHPSLAGHLADGGWDYIDDDADPNEERNGRDDDGDGKIDEAYGHGTHTAGLVALIAPKADILVYRVLDADGEGDPYVVAQAINDAIDAGADVINVSFGMAKKPKSKVVREAFERAKKADVSVVAAAGNDGDDVKRYPAESSEVISVGALGRDGRNLARFSNHGKYAMVAAPGEDIVSTLPDGTFGAWSGTSMASPIVAGQVALLRSHDSSRVGKKVVERVEKSAIKMKGKYRAEKGLIDILASLDD